MRLVRFDATRGGKIERFGSEAFRIRPLARLAHGHMICVRLDPVGRIGRPRTAGGLTAIVVEGDRLDVLARA